MRGAQCELLQLPVKYKFNKIKLKEYSLKLRDLNVVTGQKKQRYRTPNYDDGIKKLNKKIIIITRKKN